MLLGSLLVALCGTASVNVVLDPYGAYRWIELPTLAPYREEFESRIARAEILDHEPCELVILGTSRAQVALDPRDPAWGRSACNLSVTGAGIAEVRAVARQVFEYPKVREIVWTVDFLSFRAGEPRHPEFLRSRFNPTLGVFEYHAGLLLGGAALRASWHVLRDYRDGVRSPFDELGMTHPGLRPRSSRHHERFVWALERDVRALGSREPFAYAPETVTDLWESVAEAVERGLAVTLIVLPSHVLHYESLDRFGQWESFERWREDLLDVRAEFGLESVLLHDCTAYVGPAAEPVPPPDSPRTMRWHWESAHIKAEFGARVTAELRRPGPDVKGGPPLCTRLDRETLSAHLARIRSDREAYRSTETDQLLLLREARTHARSD